MEVLMIKSIVKITSNRDLQLHSYEQDLNILKVC